MGLLKGETPQQRLPFPLKLKIRWGIEVSWSEKQNYHIIWHRLKLARIRGLLSPFYVCDQERSAILAERESPHRNTERIKKTSPLLFSIFNDLL